MCCPYSFEPATTFTKLSPWLSQSHSKHTRTQTNLNIRQSREAGPGRGMKMHPILISSNIIQYHPIKFLAKTWLGRFLCSPGFSKSDTNTWAKASTETDLTQSHGPWVVAAWKTSEEAGVVWMICLLSHIWMQKSRYTIDLVMQFWVRSTVKPNFPTRHRT